MVSPQNTKKVIIILAFLFLLGIIFSVAVISIFLLNKNSFPLIKDSSLFPTLTADPTQIVHDDLIPSVTDTPDDSIGKIVSPTPSTIGYPNRLAIEVPDGDFALRQSGGDMVIKGQMRGFFEGVMNYRIVDGENVILSNGIIQAQGDNYEGFVPFEVSISYGELESDKYFLEYYDVSMKDGSINVLSRIPLRII